MAEFIINSNSVRWAATEERMIANKLINIQNSIDTIMNNLQFNIASTAMIGSRLKKTHSDVYKSRRSAVNMNRQRKEIPEGGNSDERHRVITSRNCCPGKRF